MKVHHRCQQHWWQICYRNQQHRRQSFATGTAGVVDTGGKLFEGTV